MRNIIHIHSLSSCQQLTSWCVQWLLLLRRIAITTPPLGPIGHVFGQSTKLRLRYEYSKRDRIHQCHDEKYDKWQKRPPGADVAETQNLRSDCAAGTTDHRTKAARHVADLHAIDTQRYFGQQNSRKQ